MKLPTLAILIAGLLVPATGVGVRADIDLSATSRGITSMTGAIGSFDTNNTWRVLLEQNNVLMPNTGDSALGDTPSYADPIYGLAAENPLGVGYLSDGPDDSYFAIDRLAVVVVKQLLGFSGHDYLPSEFKPDAESALPPLLVGDSVTSFDDGSLTNTPTGSSLINRPVKPVVVPEPSSMALLVLAAAGMLGFGRRPSRDRLTL